MIENGIKSAAKTRLALVLVVVGDVQLAKHIHALFTSFLTKTTDNLPALSAVFVLILLRAYSCAKVALFFLVDGHDWLVMQIIIAEKAL